MSDGNLFGASVAAQAGEQFTRLFERPGVWIERIVSTGQSSPPGFWYDQPADEWVLVVSGAARLRFEDEATERDLKAGDFVAIAAHRRHRVDWTDPARPTVWLAIHIGDSAAPPA